jgi:hypothetical protein
MVQNECLQGIQFFVAFLIGRAMKMLLALFSMGRFPFVVA